jgi:hypothetical protein
MLHLNGTAKLSAGNPEKYLSIASSSGTMTGRADTIDLGASNVYLKYGTTTVLSIVGSIDASFAGNVSIASSKALTAPTVKAKHACYDGTAAKADGSFSFYAAASSGGAVTVQHTVTFKDGLITSWSAA